MAYRTLADMKTPKLTLRERILLFYSEERDIINTTAIILAVLAVITGVAVLVTSCDSSAEKSEDAAFVGVQNRAIRWVSDNHLAIIPTTIHCVRHEPGQGRGTADHNCSGMTQDSRVIHLICSRTDCRAE